MISEKDFGQTVAIMDYLQQVPYDVTRKTLYCAHDLYEGYNPLVDESFNTCFDSKVYHHFVSTGKQRTDAKEKLARTLHDHGVYTALDDFFKDHDQQQCVGIMGGHAQLRNDPNYRDIVLLSKRLTEQGFCMLSGGGPGAMEATHLGAWMAGRSVKDVDWALQLMSGAPSFNDTGWLSTAWQVMERFPQEKYHSLGIPTWLYGHEPSTPFATHIAKFFENSIREDNILTLAYGGIIYTPGRAGTLQEIFQDAVQNHYLSLGLSSPMIFMGKKFWTEEMPVYPLLESMAMTGKYHNLILSITDDPEEIVEQLENFRATHQMPLSSKQ